jgi:hypothetical protein
VSIEEDGVGDGFHGFDEVEGFRAWEDEWVVDAMAFGKNEETGGWGIVEADPDKNKASGGVFFIERGKFGKLFGGSRVPGDPEVKEDKFAAEGGGVEGLAAG